MRTAAALLHSVYDKSHTPTVADLARQALGTESTGLSDRECVDEWLSGRRRSDSPLTAAVLLHLLSEHPDAFVEQPLRNTLFTFFDRTIGPTCYQPLRIDAKDATHSKETVLRGLVVAAVEAVSAVVADFRDLSGIHALRNDLPRALKSPAHRAVLEPFLPPRPTKGALAAALDYGQEVVDARGSELMSASERVLDALRQLDTEIAAAETDLAADLLGSVVFKIRTFVMTAVADSPFSDPAHLVVATTDKKYPLHTAGTRVRLQLRIRNEGRGEASRVEVAVSAAVGVELDTDRQRLGTIEPGAVTIALDGFVDEADGVAIVAGEVTWVNFDGLRASAPFEVEFVAQSADVPWERLAHETPYALVAITEVDQLIGRAQVVDGLVGLLSGRSMGNAFVTGHRRVGKTSIAKTVRSLLDDNKDFRTVYLQTGDYVTTDPKDTPASLGTALCQAIQESDPRFAQVDIPDFSTGLAQIRTFFGSVRRIDPKLRVLLILDEFDDLPVTLYRLSPLANALFSTFRTLADKEYIGFILVGGERINAVIGAQGEALNTFDQYRIDYLDRETRWEDFQDLVRLPVKDWGIEVADSAVLELYAMTAGHPYFTKLICKSMFEQMRELRDGHATAHEVGIACRHAIEMTGAHSFQHFWRDGILDEGERVEIVSARRAKVLLALSQAIVSGYRDTAAVVTAGIQLGLSESEVRVELLDFVQREVLVEDAGQWRCKVRFFEDWLLGRGVTHISTQYSDEEAVVRYATARTNAAVKTAEIDAVLAGWGPYRNIPRTVEDVRVWLSQFGGPKEQRAVFPILQGLVFHSGASLREAMKEAHQIARMHTTQRIEEGKKKRDDFVVSYLDGAGKSGARFAHLYVDTNNIYTSQVVSAEGVQAKLTDGVQTLVFVDDFLGSGGSIVSGLEMIAERCGKLVRGDGFQLVVVAVTGFAASRDVVLKAAEALGLTVRMHVCRPLTERDRVFGENSRFYEDPDQREEARLLVMSAGERLNKRDPLGFKNGQAAVVFDEACPNLSLPVLWEKGKSGNEWVPLFPRYATT